MKKIMIALFAILLTLGVSAQKGYGRHYYRGGGFRTHISAGFYAPYYYPGYYGYGYPPAYYYARPTRLDMEISDIKADYQDRIWSARHDKSIPRSERRKKIHELKVQRDQEIRDTERNYYKERR